MIPTRGNLRFFRAQKRRAAVFPMTVALILILLGVAGIALYWPAAHLTIQVKAQPFQETVKSTVDTEAAGVDVEKVTIPGQVLTLEQLTKSTAKTTGKKDIGDKATGAVTIQNGWDSLPHNFPAATKLRAKGGLEFVLAKEVTVPGATSTIVSGKAVIVPGKVEGAVAAASPGEAYNIAPSDLKIPSLPAAQQESIYATAAAAFSGGTSNVVSVVSESDLQKLTENVKTQNREEATAKFKEQAANQVIIDPAIQIGGQEVTAANQVGEEAAAVEVAVKGTFRVIAFSPADQKQLLEKLLASKIPEGQILVTEGDDLTPDTSTYTLDLVSDKRLELTNNLKAFTVQKFDPQVIRRSLIGDAPDAALTIISRSLPAADVQTAITPPWWPRLPLVAKRITLDFQYRPEIKE